MDFFAQFIPHSLHEWIYIVIIALLLLTVLLYNKAMMKAKQIIEAYTDEVHELKKGEGNE